MRKLIIALILLVRTATLCAQQQDYNWRLGFSGGFSNYYGDLSPLRIHALNDAGKAAQLFQYNSNYVERPSYRVSLEHRLGNTVGLMVSAGSYQFAGSDRHIDRKSALNTNAPEFRRALNFNTTLRDVGLSLVFKTDNDELLSKNAFFAPYFTLGAGWFNYDVSGDLRDDNGNFYDYTSGSLSLNGEYETDLSQIQTNQNNYITEGWYTNLGLGLKFRISRRIDFHIETNINFTNSDFLDDVSGAYPDEFTGAEQSFASRPALPGSGNLRGTTNHNDLYIYHGASLKYNFGYREKSFKAPTVRNYGISEYTMEGGIYSIKQDSSKLAAQDSSLPATQIEIPHTTLNVFNYAAVIQEDDTRFKEQTNEHLYELRKLLEINEAQTSYRHKNEEVAALQNEINSIDEQIQKWENDTLAPADERREKLKKLGSDQKQKQELLAQTQTEMDSLNQSISEIRSRTVPVDSNAGTGTKVIIGADTQTYYLPGNMQPVKRTVKDTVYWGKPDTSQKQISYIQESDTGNWSQTADAEEKPATMPGKEPQASEQQVNELQQQINTLREELAASQNERPINREQIDDARDAEMRDLRNEIAELRAALNNREREKVTPLPAVDVPQPDLSAVNANLAAQTAAISALSYALLRDNKTTDEEKEKIQNALSALDTLGGNQDSLNLVLDSIAQNRINSTYKERPVNRVKQRDTLYINTASKTATPKKDSALRALELRIEKLSEQVSNNQVTAAPPDSDSGTKNIDKLLLRIEELNKKLEAEKEKTQVQEKSTQKTELIQIESVYFALNSASVSTQDENIITRLVKAWKMNKSAIFELTAYADNTGRFAYNINMCEKRLETVKRKILASFKPHETKPQINLIIGGTVVRSSINTPKQEDRKVEIKLMQPER